MAKTRASACLPIVLAAASALLLLAPVANSDAVPVAWTAPTPADQTHFTVKLGRQLRLTLAATTAAPDDVVHIAVAGPLPKAAVFHATDGATAEARMTWTPRRAGDYTIGFTAATVVGGSAPTITYSIHVPQSRPKVRYPLSSQLTDEKIARWSPVLHRAIVRAEPRVTARRVANLDTWTTDDTQNIVLVLARVDKSSSQTWYRVRLPILPNNSVGWVQARALGEIYTVHTHLYVDRASFRATLKRDGVTVFRTIVGLGKSYWPTPRGEFYIRDKLTSFGNPVYGPVAFGTSARSAVLTDWPGGGFVGVHGTNEPQILPGRVSHGCIRMPNAAILKLAGLMPVGTPLTVR
jgi:hypothetical protein